MRSDLVQDVARAVYVRAMEDDAASGHYAYPYSRLQHIGFFILFFFNALAIAVFTLRLYGRLSTKQFGWGEFYTTMRPLFIQLY